MVSIEPNHLLTGQHTNSKTADKLPGAMTVRSVLLNRDSPDIESRLKRRRNRTHQVRFKDLEDGVGDGTTGAGAGTKGHQRIAAECNSPHPLRKNTPTSPMAPQGWLTERSVGGKVSSNQASVVGAVRGDMADTIEVVAAFLARAPPHPLTPGPTRRCWAPPPSPPRPCSLTLPLSRRQCASMAIQTSSCLQKPKLPAHSAISTRSRNVGDSVWVNGDDEQDNKQDEYYTTHNHVSEPASIDGNGPGSKAKQGLVDQPRCLRTSEANDEANASSTAVGNHMDSSRHDSSSSPPPVRLRHTAEPCYCDSVTCGREGSKRQGSATPSQVRRRRRMNRGISDPGREVSYCTTPTQTDSPCVSPPNTPPPSTVQPCTSPPPSTVEPSSLQTQTVPLYASLPKTVPTSTHPHCETPPLVVLPCAPPPLSICTYPPKKSVLPPTVLPSKAQTTPPLTTQTETVPPCTSLIQIKLTCTTTTTTTASIPNCPTPPPTPTIAPYTAPNCHDPKPTPVLAPYTAPTCPNPTPTTTLAPSTAPTFPTPNPTLAPYTAPTCPTPTPTPNIAPCTILTQTPPPCSSLNQPISPPPNVTSCHPPAQTAPPYISLIQTIPPGNPPCQTVPPCSSQPPVVPSYSAHIQLKYCSSPSPIVKSCNSPPPMVKSYHTLPTGPSCATPTKTVPLYASTFRPAPPYTPPPQAQHCSTQDSRVIEWECRGERRILPPPPPPPPPYTPRKEGVSCTPGLARQSSLLRRAGEKERSGRSGSPLPCPQASCLKHRAQTPLAVPLKGNQGDQGSSPTKAISRPTCLGQAQAQLGAQLGALHKMLCSGTNTPNSQQALPPGQCLSGDRGCSGSGGGPMAGPLTSTQADTLKQVQEILGGLVSGARSKLDPTWVAEKLMGPNGPLHDIRSLQTQLHSMEGVLETSQNTIKVLLDVIQDLEKKEAERDGRHSYRTGQDIENCGTCRDCACIIYSVEHDFRLQEGAVIRTWRVGDPPEGSPLATVTPQPTTPHRQDSPLPVTPARPSHSGKKSRKKCFWFL
ncbi:proline-rich protein 36 [Coregonus clupeaformis]|uniref:proline-rich protein 36 n=1 Tax=Coregonus clupeaformis TaxID=59861 RepID=UPI001E1C4E6C|nr:proline-rich protein 36 [Coregonus clupeaformis]